MIRRNFLALLPAAAHAQRGRKKQPETPPPPPPPGAQVEAFFLDIARGYIANAGRTSPSLAVVEYPQATITQNFLAKSKLSATGTTRMLPALAAWTVSGRQPDSGIKEALIAAYKNGCDPNSPDYWLPNPDNTQNQRQVESSIVAWSLWLARDSILPALSQTERRNVSAWLESCTRRPVRSNNWAWFTAVNIAVRMRLAEQYPEFHHDEAFMLDDLKALDAMAAGDSGWYNDGLTGQAFDYYNSWVFASHFLYWNELAGARYPDIAQRFKDRLARYLDSAPYFFSGSGAHVLYGRSLIYRWGVLTPLILAYQQKLWPHSPGLLRRIAQQNILWHKSIGALDPQSGKLRETLTPEGAHDICETYIDGGHPYWGMQAFAFWRTPPDDPFWTAPEEPLPVEKSDYAIALPEPGMLIVGTRSSGQVRLFNARSTRSDPTYRDKYNKLVYSSHFPFAVTHDKTHPTLDNTLSLRNPTTGARATRGEITNTVVEAEHVELDYAITLDGATAKVHTEIRFRGEFEARQHTVEATGENLAALELVEGGAPYSPSMPYKEMHLKTWNLRGWKTSKTEDATGSILTGAHKVQTLSAPLAPAMRLASLRYQSPKAMPKDNVDSEAQALAAGLRL